MKQILIVTLILAGSMTACKDAGQKKTITTKDDYANETKDSKEKGDKKTRSGGFDIKPPKGWERNDTTMMGSDVVFLMSPREGVADNFQENVNVLTEKVYGMEMDKYVDLNIRNMETGLNGFRKGSLTQKEMNGIDFTRLRYSHVSGIYTLDCEVYFVIEDGTAYVITCTAKAGQLDKWEGDFEEAVNSFRLL